MTALAITGDLGVEMQRPGLGDLAGRGATCGCHPDLWKCCSTSWAMIMHRIRYETTSQRQKLNTSPVCGFPHAAERVDGRSTVARARSLQPRAPEQQARGVKHPGARQGAAGNGRVKRMRLCLPNSGMQHASSATLQLRGLAVRRRKPTPAASFGSECHDNG